MFLKRNFVWTLDLSDRELKLIIKLIRDEDLDDDDQSLADKLADSLSENALRLDRVSLGSRRRTGNNPDSER